MRDSRPLIEEEANVQRAAQTFHLPTADGWRTIAAGVELADDDQAVTTAPQYFVAIPDPVATGPAETDPAAAAGGDSTAPPGQNTSPAGQPSAGPEATQAPAPEPVVAEPAPKKPAGRSTPRGKSAR